MAGIALGVFLAGCGGKEEAEPVKAAGEKEVASEVAEPGPAEPASGDALDKRAAALGFGKHLPASTHGYLGVFDGKGFVDSLRGSELGEILEARAEEEGMDLEDMEEDPAGGMVLALLAEEVFVAVGEGTPEQAANLAALNESMRRHQMKLMVKLLEMNLTGGEDAMGPMGMQMMMMPLVGGFLRDPAGGLAVLEESQMPPLMVGCKVSDEEMRQRIADMAQGGMMKMLAWGGPDGEDIFEAANIESGGSKFSGVKIVGEKIAAKIGKEERENLAQFMDPATVERLIKFLKAKSLLMAVGVREDYVVGFLGSGTDELQFAGEVSQSAVARSEFGFLDGYTDKKLLGVMAMSKDLQDAAVRHSAPFGSIAKGIREGLRESEGFGDTRDLEILLDLVAKQEKALMEMNRFSAAGVVAYREKGLKIESYGGGNAAGMDFEAKHRYGRLAEREGVFVFANWVADEEYSGKLFEYLDTVGETLYLGAKQAAGLDIDEADFEEFKEWFALIDGKFRPHALEIWQALRGDLLAGLGNEAALVMDLDGELPAVPGLPQAVVDNGKAPRLGVIAPVDDRAKLGACWERLDKAVRGILEVVATMTDNKIPMQKPMSSESDDLKTWFFPFPFQTDDFVLSASLDEADFFLATSKSFVKELAGAIESGEAGAERRGAYVDVDLVVLTAYLNDWIKLFETHGAEMFGADSPRWEEFRENLPMLKRLAAASGELKAIRAHTRKEDGIVRSSIFFEAGE